MNEELKQIKSAIGEIPKPPQAQKQDKTRQACAGLCADNSSDADKIVRLRRKVAEMNNISEEKAATAMNQLMILQQKIASTFSGAHSQIINMYDKELRRTDMSVEQRSAIMGSAKISVIYNLCVEIERASPKSKNSLAGMLLEVIRASDGFVAVKYGGTPKTTNRT